MRFASARRLRLPSTGVSQRRPGRSRSDARVRFDALVPESVVPPGAKHRRRVRWSPTHQGARAGDRSGCEAAETGRRRLATAASVVSLAIRPPRGALGLRRRSADLLDARGEPRVPRDQRRFAAEAVDVRTRPRVRAARRRHRRRARMRSRVRRRSHRSSICLRSGSSGSPPLFSCFGSSSPRARPRSSSRSLSRTSEQLRMLRWPPLRSFLSFSVVLPVLGLARLRDDRARLRSRIRARSKVDVEDRRAGRAGRVRRVLGERAHGRSTATLDARALPGLRSPRARRHVVSPRDDRSLAYTTQAVPAIVTGLASASETLCRRSPTTRSNLFTLLGETYAFRVCEPVTRLCARQLLPATIATVARCAGAELLQDVGDQLPPRCAAGRPSGRRLAASGGMGASWRPRGRARRVRRARSVGPTPPETLYFLHLMQPHVPWALASVGTSVWERSSHRRPAGRRCAGRRDALA